MSTTANPLHSYPHNAYAPLPYPLMHVQEIRDTPLHTLCRTLAVLRLSFSRAHAVLAARILRSDGVTVAPFHRDAQESLAVSNVSATRIMEVDWSAIGGTKVVCGYRYPVSNGFVLTNMLHVSGRLADGSVVLDMCLRRRRLESVEREVNTLIAASNHS